MTKTVKILLGIIILIIIIMVAVLLHSINVKTNNEEIISISNNSDVNSNRIKLNSELSYETAYDANGYTIYDKDGNFVAIVYDQNGLEFYKNNPDYRENLTPITGFESPDPSLIFDEHFGYMTQEEYDKLYNN